MVLSFPHIDSFPDVSSQNNCKFCNFKTSKPIDVQLGSRYRANSSKEACSLPLCMANGRNKSNEKKKTKMFETIN